MEGFTKSQRHTVLRLEHRNLLIFIFIGNPPDVKKQIEDNIVGWEGQPPDIIQVATQFFEELKNNCTYITNLVFIRTEIWL